MDLEIAKLRYGQQKCNTYKRKDRNGNQIEWKITFDEWLAVWVDSGRWEQRGFKAGEYVMSRIGDVGPYEVGNVRIIESVQNKLESQAMGNKGRFKPGNVLSKETIEKQRQKRIGKPRPKVTCPHCGFTGGTGTTHKYHFNNCKLAK